MQLHSPALEARPARPQATVRKLCTAVQAVAIGFVERCEVAAPLLQRSSQSEANRPSSGVHRLDR
jgi:hypothetical protein